LEQTAHPQIAPGEYQSILHEMVSAYALHEIILDTQGRPVNYRFLDVNRAFEAMTGLKAETILGKTVREIMPSIQKEWIDRYGQVALSGQSISFQDFARELGKYFQVSAFCPPPRPVCRDIYRRFGRS
jgi:two-component system CheB/CheR fusion protein